MAAARGAVGLIDDPHPLRRRRAQPSAAAAALRGRPGTTWIEPDGTPFDEAPGLRFSATVDRAARAAPCSPARSARSRGR